MALWRISRHRDLTGLGGLRANGRWHYVGQRVVYLSESPASALLEVCVHTAANDVPPEFTLMRVEGPIAGIQAIEETDLPAGWRERVEVTRELGTAWLRGGAEVLLRVPSAIVPRTANFLLNPSHPDAGEFRIAERIEYPFDLLLKQ